MQPIATILNQNQLAKAESNLSLTTETGYTQELTKIYRSSCDFLKICAPDKNYLCIENEKQAYTGRAVSLNKIKKGFGSQIAEMWLMAQLESLNDFCGVKEKANEMQLFDLSKLIISEFGHLKVSELMLFFAMFKLGKFGRFFGVVDPIVITSALDAFLAIRMQKLSQFKSELEQEQKEHEQKEHDLISVDRETYNEISWLFKM